MSTRQRQNFLTEGHEFLESQSEKVQVRDGCFLLMFYSDFDSRGQNFMVGGASCFIFSGWLDGKAVVLVRDFAQGGYENHERKKY